MQDRKYSYILFGFLSTFFQILVLILVDVIQSFKFCMFSLLSSLLSYSCLSLYFLAPSFSLKHRQRVAAVCWLANPRKALFICTSLSGELWAECSRTSKSRVPPIPAKSDLQLGETLLPAPNPRKVKVFAAYQVQFILRHKADKHVA